MSLVLEATAHFEICRRQGSDLSDKYPLVSTVVRTALHALLPSDVPTLVCLGLNAIEYFVEGRDPVIEFLINDALTSSGPDHGSPPDTTVWDWIHLKIANIVQKNMAISINDARSRLLDIMQRLVSLPLTPTIVEANAALVVAFQERCEGADLDQKDHVITAIMREIDTGGRAESIQREGEEDAEDAELKKEEEEALESWRRAEAAGYEGQIQDWRAWQAETDAALISTFRATPELAQDAAVFSRPLRRVPSHLLATCCFLQRMRTCAEFLQTLHPKPENNLVLDRLLSFLSVCTQGFFTPQVAVAPTRLSF